MAGSGSTPRVEVFRGHHVRQWQLGTRLHRGSNYGVRESRSCNAAPLLLQLWQRHPRGPLSLTAFRLGGGKTLCYVMGQVKGHSCARDRSVRLCLILYLQYRYFAQTGC